MVEQAKKLQKTISRALLTLLVVTLIVQIFSTVFQKQEFFLEKRYKSFKPLFVKSTNYKLAYEPKPKLRTNIEWTNIELNSLGLRSHEPYSRDEIKMAKAESKKHFSVLVLGDELAFGWRLAQDKVFSNILEEDLKAKYPRRFVEVINAAVPSYSDLQTIEFFLSRLKLIDPDLIVWVYEPDLLKLGKKELKAAHKELKEASHLLANYLHESYLNSPKRMKIIFAAIPSPSYSLSEYYDGLEPYIKSKDFQFYRSLEGIEDKEFNSVWLDAKHGLLNAKGHQILAKELLSRI